jgi:hypothetical protein
LPTRVYIYGSCVTRDSVDWFADYDFELVGYTARCTLPSAMSRLSLEEISFDYDSVKSKFEREMLISDITGALISSIQSRQPDVVVWDLCDERNGVIEIAPNKFLSGNSAYDDLTRPPGSRYSWGTPENQQVWVAAFERFMNELGGQRLVVNATPWAKINSFGEEVSGGARKARNFNSNSVFYLDHIRAHGVPVIELDQTEVVAKVDHKWGEAPFHYTDETYARFLSKLRAHLAN